MGISNIYIHRRETLLNLSYGTSGLVIYLEKYQTEIRQPCKLKKN